VEGGAGQRGLYVVEFDFNTYVNTDVEGNLHTLTLVVTDSAGESATTSIQFIVDGTQASIGHNVFQLIQTIDSETLTVCVFACVYLYAFCLLALPRVLSVLGLVSTPLCLNSQLQQHQQQQQQQQQHQQQQQEDQSSQQPNGNGNKSKSKCCKGGGCCVQGWSRWWVNVLRGSLNLRRSHLVLLFLGVRHLYLSHLHHLPCLPHFHLIVFVSVSRVRYSQSRQSGSAASFMGVRVERSAVCSRGGCSCMEE
jgi:hypothetical protein